MQLKVCGISENEHLNEVAAIGVKMVGLNFYQPSPRYFTDPSAKKIPGVSNVGIFVQSALDEIEEKAARFSLVYAQLHGDEDVDFCKDVQAIIPVIKVFRVDEGFDFNTTLDFDFCELFLFDTMTKAYGGSGVQFDWSMLDAYTGKTPFLLSGGIGPGDTKKLKIKHPAFYGVDINSRFEIEPGVKNLALLRNFVQDLKMTQ